NDTVSTAELEYLNNSTERIFGDNDRLAAHLMSKLEADMLILLTDVDGLLFRKTKKGSSVQADERAEAIPFVKEITAELRAAAAGPSARDRKSTRLNSSHVAISY